MEMGQIMWVRGGKAKEDTRAKWNDGGFLSKCWPLKEPILDF